MPIDMPPLSLQRKSLLRTGRVAALFTLCVGMLSGCGTGVTSFLPAKPTAQVSISGHVHGGQQPVVGSRIYLYAVSTTAGGASTSLLNTPGFVLSDLNGGFSISGDYTCPSGSYVYLLALGGNPGLVVADNTQIALAAGLGACSALTASDDFVINEVTTVALAYTMSGSATSDIQIGATSDVSGSNALAPSFVALTTFTDAASGTALATNAAGTALPQANIYSLANALAACVNSTGVGAPCSTLMTDALVPAGGSTPVDTFQAALTIAQNPTTVNVSGIYDLASANAAFQPALTSAPSNWSLAVAGYTPPGTYTTPSFFDGATVVQPPSGGNNAVYYLSFPNGNYFGDYTFLSDPIYLYHFDLGFEYIYDANDGVGGIYLYDFASEHFWYTSPIYPFPYLYDFTLGTELYYYPDPYNPGHYTSNPREFYDYATSTIITL